MYKVLIFGTGNLSVLVESELSENVLILAYVDNDKTKWNSKRNEKVIVAPDKIKNYAFDYIIIGSQFNEEIYTQLISMGIDKNKIFQYTKFSDNYRNYYKVNIDSFILNLDVIYEVLATGISYTSLGFTANMCVKRAFNFAFPGQDLFYDYNTIKYLLENYKYKMNDVKYIIIGLSYYSFQYDMSLSAMKGKTVLYYEVLKSSHNFNDINRVYEECDINKNIADNILRKKKNGNYDFKWIISNLNDLKNKENVGEKQAKIDCNKSYPETVKENRNIFRKYLKLLKDNYIKPIVVVFPASKYYTRYFSKRIEDEFHSIINEVKKEYDFQYIDYFRLKHFEDDDFQDVSHLNSKGAEKFTKILNEEIEW